jgi:DNA repair exonuclease SbcCD ATPase subunit
MRINRITMLNFGPFRGEQTLELDAKSYAVVAQRIEDPSRSNYCGKSSLLEAVDLALYGRHRHPLADGWITRGESEGFVELEIEGLGDIRRERKRGKATRLTVGNAKGDEAEKFILQTVGLTAEDFVNTCYFQQRNMARFVLADPGKRMDVVSGWLRLAPLERAEKIIREKVIDLSGRAAQHRSNMDIAAALKARELGERQSAETLRSQLNDVEQNLAKAQTRLSNLRNLVGKNERLRELASFPARYAQLLVDETLLLDEYRKQSPKLLGDAYAAAQQQDGQARAEQIRAENKHTQALKLSRGEFDGLCPVAGIQCPAKEQINADRTPNEIALSNAAAACLVAEEKADVASIALRNASVILQEHERLGMKVNNAQVAREKLLPMLEEAKTAPPPDDPNELQAKVTTAQNIVVNLSEQRASLRRSLDLVEASVREQQTLVDAIAAIDSDLAVHREALAIFGKQGAQRRVAENALAEIQDNANRMLQMCDVDLSVEVRWSREGQGLASVCDSCGAPHARSERVKQCERCGAARGPLLINKLDVVLSDRSGAAEDLVGAAVQLAASSWLRADRQIDWSVAMIDEPFGQLDEYGRQAFAGHLGSLLRNSFKQSFVIAHHSSVLDALPGRILVEKNGAFSTARIVG